MFKTRLMSGIVLLAIAIAAIVTGGYVLFGLMLAVSVMGMYELYKIYHMEFTVPAFAGYLSCIGYYLLVLFEKTDFVMLLFIGFMLICMTCYVAGFPKYKTEQMTCIFFALFYVAVMLCCIYQIRMLEGGKFLVWLVFIGSWGSDTCAYAVGRLFGKHKAFPVLSPKKSVEGCIGGILGAALIGVIYALALRSHLTMLDHAVAAFAVIGGASSILAQIGDLAASAIKRNHGIKDYSNLIPGHGGILDRFDSVIFTAPVVYYLITLFVM